MTLLSDLKEGLVILRKHKTWEENYEGYTYVELNETVSPEDAKKLESLNWQALEDDTWRHPAS